MINPTQAHDEDDWDASEYEPRRHPASPASTPSRDDGDVSPTAPNALERDGSAQERSRARGAAGTAVRAVPRKKNPNHFPGFIARSALFRVSTSRERFGAPTAVKAQGCALTLTGPKLGMRDKHVWEIAIQIAKARAGDVGDAFEIELSDFASRMGLKSKGGRVLDAIWDSLERIALARVEFQIGEKCKGVGSLLATAARENGRIYLRLNPDFALPALLGDKQFLFDQARRSSLPTALSQWLHDFFSTHSIARDLDVGYLRNLCGYEGVARNFPGKLREAMETLMEAAPGLVASFVLDKSARDSESWKLKVEFGAEKPSFLKAETIPDSATHRRGRGGVAL